MVSECMGREGRASEYYAEKQARAQVEDVLAVTSVVVDCGTQCRISKGSGGGCTCRLQVGVGATSVAMQQAAVRIAERWRWYRRAKGCSISLLESESTSARA